MNVPFLKKAGLLLLFACLLLTSAGNAVRLKAAGTSSGVVVVTLAQNNEKTEIKNLTVRKTSSHVELDKARSLKGIDKTHKLRVKDKDGKVLYSTPFSFPSLRTIPPVPPGEAPDGTPAAIRMKNPEVTIVVPYFTEADSIEVLPPGSSEAETKKSLRNAKEEYSDENLTRVGKDGKLDILIVASGYSQDNMNLFRDKANSMKEFFLAREPFLTYKDKVNIQTYENQENLNCAPGAYGIPRLMTCSDSSVMDAAAKSGLAYDEIIVVHRTDTYSGSGSRDNNNTGFKTNSYSTYSVVYDGPSSEVMALHEFGHSFGNLCDEYTYGTEGYTYFNCVNCRKNESDLSNLVTGECAVGCDAKPAYFRPEDSVMLTLSIDRFNTASIKATYAPYGLEIRLNHFVSN